MEQTAVKKLELKLLGIISFDSEELRKKYKHAIDQAKAMEKEQIIESVVNTVKIGTEKEGVLFFTSEDEILIRNEAEQYYNETFKSE